MFKQWPRQCDQISVGNKQSGESLRSERKEKMKRKVKDVKCERRRG